MKRHLLILFSVFLAGCFGHPVGVFDSSYPLQDRTYKVIGDVDEKACDGYGFGIFGRPYDATVSAIMKKTLEKYKADAIIGGTIDATSIHLILGSEHCIYLKGKAIKFEVD